MGRKPSEPHLIKASADIFDDFFKEIRNGHQKKKNIVYKFELYAQLLLHYLCFGRLNVTTDKYLFIDEGQDLSVREYELLNNINNDGVVFNVFGDINQVISNHGIHTWDNLSSIFKFDEYQLNENYRNAIAINQHCNVAFGFDARSIGIDDGKVNHIPLSKLSKMIAASREKDDRIAVIATKQELYQLLELSGIYSAAEDINKLYSNDVSLLTPSAAKGLEFDTAFVINNGLTKNEKYIAYTRALKTLMIIDE